MNEAVHEIDRQFDDLYRKAAEDNSQTVDVGGARITQVNHLSSWVILGALGIVLLAMALLGIGLNMVSNQTAVALGIANQAERQAQNAEREARVAMDKAEELRVMNGVNTALISGYLAKGK